MNIKYINSGDLQSENSLIETLIRGRCSFYIKFDQDEELAKASERFMLKLSNGMIKQSVLKAAVDAWRVRHLAGHIGLALELGYSFKTSIKEKCFLILFCPL